MAWGGGQRNLGGSDQLKLCHGEGFICLPFYHMMTRSFGGRYILSPGLTPKAS